MAGPLSGFFTQPIVGLYGDQSTHPLGRRRPLIIYGGLCTVISLLTFAWCKELAQLILPSGTQGHKYLSAWLAVVAFYVLDISINVVTVSNKCLIIDVLPSVEQHLANAYASRFSGFSSILTMLISLIDLPRLFNAVTTSQIQMITYFGAPIFLFTNLLTCLKVHEQPYSPNNPISSTDDGNRSKLLKWLMDTIKTFWNTWHSLDGTLIKSLCWIQLWAWIGWFPVLFYSTTWIGEIWSRVAGENDEEKATRIGSSALLIEAILSLLGWLIIPILVSNFRLKHYGSKGDFGKTLVKLWLCSQIFFGCLLLISPLCEGVVILSIILIGACGIPWAITTWAPSTLLGEAILRKPEMINDLHTNQNSFKLLPLDSAHHRHNPRSTLVLPPEEASLNALHHSTAIVQLTPIIEESSNSSSTSFNTSARSSANHNPKSALSSHNGGHQDIEPEVNQTVDSDEDGEGLLDELELEEIQNMARNGDEGKLAGTILGINNVFIVIPQFLITLISFVLFKFLESRSDPTLHSKFPSPDSTTLPQSQSAPSHLQIHRTSEIGWIFRIGGIASFVSAFLCWRLAKLIDTKFLR